MTDRQHLLDAASRCGQQSARFGRLAARWHNADRPALAQLMLDLSDHYRQRGARLLTRSVVPAGHGKRLCPGQPDRPAPLAPAAPSLPPPLSCAPENASACPVAAPLVLP